MTTDPASPSPPRPGRPRRLDDAKCREICALVSAGCTIADAARYVRCAVSTIHRERRLNQEFRAELREAEQTAQLQPLRAMQKAVSTHWRAAARLLERTHPERFAKQSPLAFGPKQARALIDDVAAIIDGENIHLYQRNQLKKRVVAAMQYAMRAAWDTRRTDRNLRRAMNLSSQREPAPIPSFELPNKGLGVPPAPFGGAPINLQPTVTIPQPSDDKTAR